MSDLDSYEIEDGSPNDVQLSVAKSLDEALHKARELNDAYYESSDSNETSNQDISCWVAGGERLYGEALRHKSLKELRLSWIHMDIAPPAPEDAIPFAKFPARYYWDNKFKEISKTFHPSTNSTPAFEHCVYQPK
jgi:dihydrofolate reductase